MIPPLFKNPDSLPRRIITGIWKTFALLASLYFFICSLTFLSSSFRILGGKNLSGFFSSSELLSNPVVGVMIGIVVTALVQSSATSTSIIVSLVSAGVSVKPAIPMIFGSNIGTSVTNTIVSMTQAGDRDCFRRAFAAATVHDMFNWLSVIILMVLEVATGFLYNLTDIIVDKIVEGEESKNLTISNPDLLKPLTKAFTERIIQVDKAVLVGWSTNDSAYANITSIMKDNSDYLFAYIGSRGLGFDDVIVGLLLLGFSLGMLCGCLIGLMKVLKSVLSDKMAILIQKTINAEIPYLPCATGYLAMLIGAVVTILVRSSSVFTSTLTPLCGTGLVTIETVYPLTLGSNIGTTTTAIIASLAAEEKYLKPSVQIALVHLFFNIIGILIFYPIPWMRWPIPMARKLGDITSKYRWFAVFYLVFMFFALPLSVFFLSWAGSGVLFSVIGAITAIASLVGLLALAQKYCSGCLPVAMRNWKFLPTFLRSLEPYDKLITRMDCCRCCVNMGNSDSESCDPNKIVIKIDDQVMENDLEGFNSQGNKNKMMVYMQESPIIKKNMPGQHILLEQLQPAQKPTNSICSCILKDSQDHPPKSNHLQQNALKQNSLPSESEVFLIRKESSDSNHMMP